MKDRIQAAFEEIRADDALVSGTADRLRGKLEKRRHESKRFGFSGLAAAFAAAVTLVAGILAYNLYFTADAYVSIDVNPSVELTLNRLDRVIGSYAFNEDGARVLNGTGLKGKPYDEAAGLVVSAIEANGYLTENSTVSVTVKAADRDREQVLCDSLRLFIDERIMSVQAEAEVEVFPVSEEVWDNAHRCHMSPAKYLAIQELIEVDKEATLDAYSDHTISQIRRRTQECRNTHTIESDGDNAGFNQWNGHGQGYCHGHHDSR